MLLKRKEIYPLYIQDLLNEHPDWTEDQALPIGWNVVKETEKPSATPGHFIKESSPVFIDGEWVQSWDIFVLSETEKQKLQQQDLEINQKYLFSQYGEL